MAFVTGELKINVYNDSSDTNFPLINIPAISRTWKSETVTQEQFARYNIAASGSLTVALNSTAPTRLYLYSDVANILVNINGLGNITFNMGEPAYLPANISSLVITNSSASLAVNVEVGFITI